jgi:hypothetical protein
VTDSTPRALTFDGDACRVCGGTQRYVNSRHCVRCARVRASKQRNGARRVIAEVQVTACDITFPAGAEPCAEDRKRLQAAGLRWSCMLARNGGPVTYRIRAVTPPALALLGEFTVPGTIVDGLSVLFQLSMQGALNDSKAAAVDAVASSD